MSTTAAPTPRGPSTPQGPSGLRVLIAGPTASGKSALALALAQILDGVVVNADSMQVYRDLALLTARPDAQALAQVPHRLYGVLDGAQRCSAGHYADLARETLADIGARPAIITGGTGLYFRVLTDGLSAMPALEPEAMDAAQALSEREGLESLHTRLAGRDPETAALIRPSDRQRLLRAWALLETTGRGLAAWQGEPAHPVLGEGDTPVIRAVLDGPRAWLYSRADRRFEAMVRDGAMDEVTRLIERGLDPGLPVMKAVGVRELAAVQAGQSDLETAIQDAQKATRHYIKRQLTWFRHQMAGWPRLDARDPDGALAHLRAGLKDMNAR